MKVNVGSKNRIKILAVQELLTTYPLFLGAEVVGVDVPLELFGHPKTLEETVEGAVQRAKNAFGECEYSIGIESGLMRVPMSKTGVMDVTVCAIYDGKNSHLGLSSAFEYPKAMTELILHHGLDASQACREVGLTTSEKVGTEEGIIAIMTNGRINRKEYTKQAIMNALVHVEHPELY